MGYPHIFVLSSRPHDLKFWRMQRWEVVPSGHTQPVEAGAGFVPSFRQLTVSILLWTFESEKPYHACCHGEGRALAEAQPPSLSIRPTSRAPEPWRNQQDG